MKISLPSFLLATLLTVLPVPVTAQEQVPALKSDRENLRIPIVIQPATPSPLRKKILLLFPYQSHLPQTMLAEQSIKKELAGVTDLKVELFSEYLDFSRFSDQPYRQQLLRLFLTKYSGQRIDIVIVVGELALRFWLNNHALILPDVPVIFFDIMDKHLSRYRLPSFFTGISSTIDHKPSVNWILKTRPSVTETVLVYGTGNADQEDVSAIDDLKQHLNATVKLTDLSRLPLTEIKRRVAALPENAVVLYHLMFEDAAGNAFRPIDVLRELTAVSAVPVISGYDQFIGTGTIGGYMFSIEEQARHAARQAIRVLRGEPVSNIPVTTDQGNRFIFDHIALQRWDIPLSALPPNSITKNRQYSLWELHRPQIIVIATGFVLLTLVVIILTGLNRQLNNTRQALSRLNAGLETQVQERSAALMETNNRLQAEISERIQTEKALLSSEARYRLLTDNAPMAVAVIDLESAHIRYTNHKTALLFETSPEEVNHVNALDLYVDPHDREQLLRKLSEHGYVNDFETQLKKQSGQAFWVSITSHISQFENRPAIHSVFLDITDRKQIEAEREMLITELQEALHKVKQLEGILPICSFCKMIRNEGDNWQRVEEYISNHSDARFSHSLCPECARKHYPELYTKQA